MWIVIIQMSRRSPQLLEVCGIIGWLGLSWITIRKRNGLSRLHEIQPEPPVLLDSMFVAFEGSL